MLETLLYTACTALAVVVIAGIAWMLAGTIPPNYAESSALCKHCAYLKECKADIDFGS